MEVANASKIAEQINSVCFCAIRIPLYHQKYMSVFQMIHFLVGKITAALEKDSVFCVWVA